MFARRADSTLLSELVHKLITCEKLLDGLETPSDMKSAQDISHVRTKLYNAYQLCLVYFKMGDTARVLRYFEHTHSNNQSFRSQIDKISQRSNSKCKHIENYILYLYQMLADTYMLQQQPKKASNVFYSVCKFYNKWKVQNSTQDR